MNQDLVITIDGPAASGKSTTARAVARELGFLYADSGALYRAVTWLALETATATDDERALLRMMDRTNVDFFVKDGAILFRIDGRTLDAELRTRQVNAHVSPVAAAPGVRVRIVEWLRSMAELGPLVMEGRDIGTVVFPAATHKFYLDASHQERTRRRHAESVDTRETVTVNEVAQSLKRRDLIDSTRRAAPLQVPPGAMVIDSTSMDLAAVAAAIVAAIQSGKS